MSYTSFYIIYAYKGCFVVNALTSCAASSKTLASSKFFNTFAMIFPTSFISSSLKPRVVTAAVPTLTPLVINAPSWSKGIVFLFVVIPTLSKASSATLPVRPS